MKKLLSILALALAFVACQTEPNDVVSNADLVDVVLNVAAPELDATRADNDGKNERNSALGGIDFMTDADWANYDLRYILEIYDENDNDGANGPIYRERLVKCVDKYVPTTFDLRLVPGRKYKFVVFADYVAEGNAELTEPADLLTINDLYYNTADLRNITCITENPTWNAMNEVRDAYFISKKVEINVSTSETLTLTRPFAKLRVVTTDLDYIKGYTAPGYVEIKYQTLPIYKSFNAVNGELNATEMAGEELTHKYEVAKHIPYTAGYDAKENSMTLFADYLLAKEGEQIPVNFEMTVYESKGGRPIHTQDFNTQIPIQRNHLTTIIGDLLTTQANITIEINDELKDGPVIGAGESDTKPVSAWGSGEIKDGNYEFVVTGENDFVVIVKDTAVENNQLKAGTYEFVENKADLENGKFTVENLQATRSLTDVNVVGGEMIVKAEETNYNITLDLVLQYEDTQEYRHAVYEYEGKVQFGESLDIPYVTATVNGNTVTVEWEAVEGATKYFVSMNNEAAVETTELLKVYENLEWNTLYTFYVKAANDTLESVVAKKEATTGEKPADEPEVFEPVASEWGVVGDLNNWGGTKDYVLYTTETENLFVAKEVKIQSGAFKIRANNDWNDANKNYGLENPGNIYADKYYSVITGSGSQNITPMEYGTYDVYFDLTNKRVALMTPGKAYAEAEDGGKPVQIIAGLKDHTWGLIGSFAGSDWGKDVATTVEGDWAVAKNVTIAKNNEFKFRADGDWALSYGSACDVNVGNTYTTYNNGGNMKFVGEDGAYDFYFSLVNAEFYMTEAGAVVEPVEPAALATPVVSADVEGNVVTLSWEAIENAAQYGITVGTEMPVFVEETTYVFTGEYETEYTFNVVAVPADEEQFAVSEAAVVTATTEAEPAVEPTYTTVAEFIAAPIDANVEYTLKGTITAVANTSYGNFDITDDTGTVYIYGLNSPDGATNKYWAASGAKLGDDIIIKTVRAEYNGSAQGANAKFVELLPGTRAFYTVDPAAVDFASTGGEMDIEVFAYNTTAGVTATSDNEAFAVEVNGYVVTVTAAANELEEAVTGNISIKVGDLEPTVVKATLAAKPAAGQVEGGSDDFHTISATNTSYVSGKTNAGWNYKNCAILNGGTTDKNPSFKMIGDESNRALCMNGKTSAVGSITSPTFSTGCGTLKFNYGLPFSDTKIMFRVDIMQDGVVVKTFTINNSSASKLTMYSHEETIDVVGDFQIVFTNLSPSASTSNKDRVAIWDVEWTGCN
ncbi:MAG: hypothetical protein J6U59_00375 [Alistipes sp.]|nr:hypothetical protein [Alistipes sp.]